MDQGSNHIRQDIDQTRAALTEKVDTLQDKARESIETVQAKARQAFDLHTQVSERPWIALGAAVAVGYVLGSLGGNSDNDDYRYSPPSNMNYEKSGSNGYRSSPSAPSQPSASSEYRYTPGQSGYSADYSQQSSQGQQHSHQQQGGAMSGFLGQFDDEIESLKVAAIGTIRELLHNTIREYVPAMGQQLDQMKSPSSTGSASSSTGQNTSYTPGTSSTSSERYSTPTTNQYS